MFALPRQYNFVAKMVWLVGNMVVGWVPLMLSIVAIALRSSWISIVVLILSAAAFMTPFIVTVFLPTE